MWVCSSHAKGGGWAAQTVFEVALALGIEGGGGAKKTVIVVFSCFLKVGTHLQLIDYYVTNYE